MQRGRVQPVVPEMEVNSSCMLNDSSLSSLRILLVSDTHYGLDQLNALGDIMKSQAVDLVLHSGDIVDIDMDRMEVPADEEAARREQVNDVITRLSSMAKGAPVYYIPGNHDPKSMFGDWEALGVRTVMVHKSACRLTSDLVLLGFGGSVPGYKNAVQVWDGVPFKGNGEMQEQLQPFLEAAVGVERSSADSNSLRPEDNILLMTHVGPNGSNTAVDSYLHGEPGSPVIGGSVYLGRTILGPAMQKHVLLDVHGHTHAGYGCTRLGKVQVINPGSLKEGRYAQLQLVKSDSGAWEVNTISFHTLP